MDLSGPGSAVAPHLADLLHATGMVPDGPVFLVQDLEKRVQPLVDMVEWLAQFAATVSAMLRAGSHELRISPVVSCVRAKPLPAVPDAKIPNTERFHPWRAPIPWRRVPAWPIRDFVLRVGTTDREMKKSRREKSNVAAFSWRGIHPRENAATVPWESWERKQGLSLRFPVWIYPISPSVVKDSSAWCFENGESPATSSLILA
jgi:hypothetical protein